MALGIYTRYRYCEAGLIALRLADCAEALGAEASLYPATDTPVRLSKTWDKRIGENRTRRFTDWAVEQDVIIWTHPPIPEQIAWAKKKGIRTGIFCLWHEINYHDRGAYQVADFVVAPNAATAAFAQNTLKVAAVVTIPWDTGCPFTKKDPRLKSDYVCVLMPLMDHSPRYVEATAIEVAGRALRRFPRMALTVAYNSSKIASFAVNRIRKFRKYFGKRVQLATSVPLEDRPLMFAMHDLAYIPVCCANTGMHALTALTMGVPVIAFDIPPFNEFLADQVNAALIPSVISMGEMGLPRLEPDYETMERRFHGILEDPDVVRLYQQHSLEGLPDRRKVFERVLTAVLK